MVATKGPISDRDPTVYEGRQRYPKDMGLVYEEVIADSKRLPLLTLEEYGRAISTRTPRNNAKAL